MPPPLALNPNLNAPSLGVAALTPETRLAPRYRYHLGAICLSLIVPITIAINYNYRHTMEILRVRFQITEIKQTLQLNKVTQFFGFTVHIKVMFIL